MKELLRYLRPQYARMGIGFVIKVIATLIELAIPWILSYMIDEIIPLKQVKLIYLYGFYMFLCTVFACIFNVIPNRMASKVARNVTEKIRNDLFVKTVYLSSRQTDEMTLPSLIARLTSDTYNIHNMVGMVQRLGVRAPIMFFGGILLTFTLDPVLTETMLLPLPFMVGLLVIVYKKGIPLYQSLQKKIDRFVRAVREDASGIRVIKALSKTEFEKVKFNQVNEEVAECDCKAGMVMGLIPPSMNLILNLGMTAVVIVGAYRVNGGVSTPGKIIAFLTYVTLILNAVLFFTRILVVVSKASASMERITEVLHLEPELTLEPTERKETDCHIVFREVSFAYHEQKSTIQNINFSLKRGEALGIIGATGSGKTTIVNLLLRFYDADNGEILIDGVNIKSIPAKKLREKFGIVFQNDILLQESFYENIRFGRDISQENVMKAASYARAVEFIEGKQSAFEGNVAIRGANLSGGQKQRLLIARALAAHPEILVLDDSSSALDYKTDAMLRKEIQMHFKDTTTIFIAQRVSSIRFADHILVLDNGQAIGYGTHEELLDSCVVYREISESQLGGVRT